MEHDRFVAHERSERVEKACRFPFHFLRGKVAAEQAECRAGAGHGYEQVGLGRHGPGKRAGIAEKEEVPCEEHGSRRRGEDRRRVEKAAESPLPFGHGRPGRAAAHNRSRASSTVFPVTSYVRPSMRLK